MHDCKPPPSPPGDVTLAIVLRRRSLHFHTCTVAAGLHLPSPLSSLAIIDQDDGCCDGRYLGGREGCEAAGRTVKGQNRKQGSLQCLTGLPLQLPGLDGHPLSSPPCTTPDQLSIDHISDRKHR